MTLALHPHPQPAIPQIRLRAPLSSLTLFHKSENQLSCFQLRAHDFVEMGGVARHDSVAMLKQNFKLEAQK
jgi:hypothetical protein